MGEFDLGTARGKIVLDNSQAIASAQSTKAAVGTLGEQGAIAGQQLKKAGTIVAGATAVMALGLKKAVDASADFEKELSAIKSVSGGSEEALEAVREKALQLGRDTAFGAGQAANAMFELSKRGLSLEEIVNGAADATVALAAASDIDLATAAAIASNAMNTFKLEAEDATQVADLLAGAANNSGTDVLAMGEAIQQVGATASTLNIPLNEVVTTLGLLGDRGISGGKAGTTLNRALLNLQPASDAAATAMENLGLITEDGTNAFFDQEGQMKSLAEVAELLNGALDGLTDQERVAALETIFGSRAIAAASALADAGANGAEGFRALDSAIGDVQATDVAAEKLDNLSGSLTILKGSVETALISLGSPLQTGIKDFADSITVLVNKFGELPKETQESIANMALLAVKIGGVITAVGAAVLVISKIIAVFKGFIAIFKLLSVLLRANPIGILITALAVLIPILFRWFQGSERAQEVFANLWDVIQRGADILIGFAQEAWSAILNFFDNLSGFGDDVIEFFRQLPDAIAEFFQELPGRLQEFFSSLPANLGTLLGLVLGTIIEFGIKALTHFTGWILEAPGIILDGINIILKTLGDAVKFIIPIAVEWGLKFVDFLIAELAKMPGRIIDLVVSFPGALQAALNTFIDIGLNFIEGLIGGFLSKGPDLVEAGLNLWETIKEGIGNIVTDVVDALRDNLQNITDFLTDLWRDTVAAFETGQQAIADTVSSVWSSIKGFIVDNITAAAQFFIDKINGMISGINSLIGFLNNLGLSIGTIPQLTVDLGNKVTVNSSDGFVDSGVRTGGVSVVVNNPAPEPASTSVADAVVGEIFLGAGSTNDIFIEEATVPI